MTSSPLLDMYTDADWKVSELAMFIGVHEELCVMARELPEKPTKGQIDRFRVAIVASVILHSDPIVVVVPDRYTTKKALKYWTKCPVIDLAKVRQARSVRALVRKQGNLRPQPIEQLMPGPYAKA